MAAAARAIDRAVCAYLAHCQRMDAWERRRRRARLAKRSARRGRFNQH